MGSWNWTSIFINLLSVTGSTAWMSSEWQEISGNAPFPFDFENEEFMKNPPAPLEADKMPHIKAYVEKMGGFKSYSNQQLAFTRMRGSHKTGRTAIEAYFQKLISKQNISSKISDKLEEMRKHPRNRIADLGGTADEVCVFFTHFSSYYSIFFYSLFF